MILWDVSRSKEGSKISFKKRSFLLACLSFSYTAKLENRTYQTPFCTQVHDKSLNIASK